MSAKFPGGRYGWGEQCHFWPVVYKPNAHLQTMTKTFGKFQKDRHKTGGGIVHRSAHYLYTLEVSRPDLFYFLVLGRAYPIFPKIEIKIKVHAHNFTFTFPSDHVFE